MKLFFIKGFVFSAIVIATFLVIAYANEEKPDDDFYIAEIIDKHRLLDKGQPNRLIIAGGSSVALGTDSEMIERELHFNVINLGLHAGLGAEFMINELIPEVRKGDIIILGIEYGRLAPDQTPDIALIKSAKDFYPKAKEYYHFGAFEYFSLLYANFKKPFEPKLTSETQHLYKRKSFNKYGDMVAHLGVNIPEYVPATRNYQTPITHICCVDRFKALSDQCKEVGARIYIVLPPFPRALNETTHRDYLVNTYNLLKRDVPFIPVLGNHETFLVENNRVFDTPYHMNMIGREEHTKELIRLLRANGITNE